MKKTRINVTIDFNIYMKLKTLNIENISEVINDFLKYYTMENNPNSKLKNELKKLEKEKTKIKEKIAIIKFKLIDDKKKKTEEEKKLEKDELEQAEQLAKGVKAAGLL